MSSTDKWEEIKQAAVDAQRAYNTFRCLIENEARIELRDGDGNLLFRFGPCSCHMEVPTALRVELEHYLGNLVNQQCAIIAGAVQDLGLFVIKEKDTVTLVKEKQC